MIILFGPAGAGKTVQGQLLSARHGWRWLSAGQLLRDTHDPEIVRQMYTGELVDPNVVNGIVGAAIAKAHDIGEVILDGFPRSLDQAQWLIEAQAEYDARVELVVVLEVTHKELMQRLRVRGREDDTAEAITERHKIYRAEVDPVLDYLSSHNVPIIEVDGTGTVGQVHDRIEAELAKQGLAAE